MLARSTCPAQDPVPRLGSAAHAGPGVLRLPGALGPIEKWPYESTLVYKWGGGGGPSKSVLIPHY